MSQSPEPFEAVVRTHSAMVFRVCRSVLGSDTDAEDAAAEALLAAMAAYPDLDAGANVTAWLVTISKRKAIDHARARTRRATPVADTADRPCADEPEPDDELWALVAQLPDKQRSAVIYHHVAGLPYGEVAEILGGTAEAARRAAADGIASLRTRLGVEGKGVRQ